MLPTETSKQRYYRLTKRRFTQLAHSEDAALLERMAADCTYSLVERYGEKPRVILLGMTHKGSSIHEQASLLRLLAESLQPEDTVCLEGNNGILTSPDRAPEFERYLHSLFPTTSIRYNDDLPAILQEARLDQVLLADSSSLAGTKLFDNKFTLLGRRDSSFCYDSTSGIITLLKKQEVSRIFQIVGLFHVALENIQQTLKREHIPYAVLVPNTVVRPGRVRDLADISDFRALNEWATIIGELGYLGKNKGIISDLDRRFGSDGWVRAFYVGGQLLTLDRMLEEYYEEGYYQFLQQRPDILDWLVRTASDVFDIDPSNTTSGTDYSHQECEASHYQDISVRRVLKRLGRRFEGDHLVQIRGRTTEGFMLNPGQIPSTHPQLILKRDEPAWWKEDSVEALYQWNKVLVVNPDRLFVRPEVLTPHGTAYFHQPATSYLPDATNPRILRRVSGREIRSKAHKNRGQYSFIKNSPLQQYSVFL